LKHPALRSWRIQMDKITDLWLQVCYLYVIIPP